MAKAVDRLRELHGDRGINGDVDALEFVDGRLNLAREFFEHQMLILHFGAELRGLEQTLAVPLQEGIVNTGNTVKFDLSYVT